MTYSKIKAHQVWSFDCETTNKEYREKNKRNDVWVIAGKNIYTKEKKIFISVYEFIKWVYKMSKTEKIYIYFHNLKFDGSYLLDWYAKNKWIPIKNQKMFINNYETLIDERKTIFFIKAKHSLYITEFRDSAKLLPMSIKEIGEELNFPKGEIDHTKSNRIYKKVSDIPQKLLDYVWRDVDILLEMLVWIHDCFSLDYLTVASLGEHLLTAFLNREWTKINPFLLRKIPDNILHQSPQPYRKRMLMGDKTYNLLPDKYFKKHLQYLTAGINWQNKSILNILLKENGEFCDCNSMYPHACKGKLPARRLLHSPPKNKEYRTFYEIQINSIKSRNINIPSVQKKSSWKSTEMIEFCNDPFVWGFWDTRLEQIKKDYIINFEEIEKWYFEADDYLKEVVEWLEDLKINAPNKAIRLFAKILLNSGLFGKQIQKEILKGYDIINNEDNNINNSYSFIPNQSIGFKRSPHIGSCITSDSQVHLLNATRENYKDENGNIKIRYVATDGFFAKGKIKGLEFDKKETGKWDIEYHYSRLKILKGNCYIACQDNIIDENGKWINDKRAMAGVDKKIKDTLSINDFYIGKEVTKPVAKWYNGGIHIDDEKSVL